MEQEKQNLDCEEKKTYLQKVKGGWKLYGMLFKFSEWLNRLDIKKQRKRENNENRDNH